MATKKTPANASGAPVVPAPEPMDPNAQQPAEQQYQPVMQPMQPVQPVQPVQATQPQYYQQQPTDPNMQQPYQPVMQPNTQYVIMQQSLQGVSGWLIFFLICFGIAALGYIWTFFASMLALSTAVGIVGLIFSPILAGGYITSVVLIAMRKRLGKLITLITLGVSAVFTVISNIVAYVMVSDVASAIDRSYSIYSSSDYASTTVAHSLPLLIAGIVVSIVTHALIALYFILSKRVKETLVN